MYRLQGILLVLVSAAAFGAMALCAGVARQDGVDTASLLVLRFVLGAGCLALLARHRRLDWPSRREARGYLLMGLVYAGMAASYFNALRFAAPSVVALVLYCYPVLVALAAGLLRIDRFGTSEAFVCLMSAAGLAGMLGGPLEAEPAGFLLAFLSALCYCLYILLGSRQPGHASPVTSSALVLAIAAVVFLVPCLQSGLHLPHSLHGWLAILFLAVISTAVAIAAFIAGLARIGPTLTAILSTLEPVVTIGLGIAFMGDRPGPRTLAGGILILAAAILLSVLRMRRPSPLPA